MRLCFIVPQTIDNTLRRKAVFEAVKTNEKGDPMRANGGGFEPERAPDGKPLRASLLLGNWQDGTGLLHASVKRGGKITEVSNFVLSRPGVFAETTLSDGSKSMEAKTVSGYHPYVQCEIELRVKDGKPVLGSDGRQVANVIDPNWVLYASATGTFAIAAKPQAPVVSSETTVSDVAE